MNKIVYIFLAVTLSGCSSLPFLSSSVAPNTAYKIEQATIQSPNEDDWVLMENKIHSLVLAKKFADKSQTAIASAMMYPAGTHKTSRAFLKFIVDQRTKQDDKNRFKIISVKNDYVTFKDLPCLKYQTLSEDHKDKGVASPEFEYFKTNGYICRYPLEYIAFQFEISHRSQEKQIPAELLRVGQEFFERIQLVELTIKRLKTIP
ncbi:MAG: hypothetical protein H7328_00295 [Bdellovibrio sp.]|nr:hypothetical protein [Bdellovibrio sp.]